MTDEELQQMKRTLIDLSKQMPLGFNDSETAIHIAGALAYELERQRGVMELQMTRAWERGADFYGLDNVPERYWKADRDRDVAKLLATEITDDELTGQTNG